MAQSITVNGNTYNDSPYDAATNPNGLANGGWRVNSKFITMLLDTLADTTTLSRTTSTTSLTIGTGSIGPLTLFQDVPLSVGDFVLISDSAAPTTNWMVGQITTRTDNDITVNVTKTEGSGTLSSWTVHLSAYPGDVGATGPAGADGVDGADYWNVPVTVNNGNAAPGTPYALADKDIAFIDPSSGPVEVQLPTTVSARLSFVFMSDPDDTNLLRIKPDSGAQIMAETADDNMIITAPTNGFSLRDNAGDWRL